MAKRTKGRRLLPYLAFWLVGWLVARSVTFIFYSDAVGHWRRRITPAPTCTNLNPSGNTRRPCCRTSWPRRNASPLHLRGQQTAPSEGRSPQILRGSSQPGCRRGWNCTLSVRNCGPSNTLGFVGQGRRLGHPQRPPNPLRTRRSENPRDIWGDGRGRRILPHHPGERSGTRGGQRTAGSHRWVANAGSGVNCRASEGPLHRQCEGAATPSWRHRDVTAYIPLNQYSKPCKVQVDRNRCGCA